MEFTEVVRRRRMVRSFSTRAVDDAVLGRILDDSLRAPSAGNTAGVRWLVLQGDRQTAGYWEAISTPEWRATSPRWPGLSRAPVVALSLTSPDQYVRRYSEADKHGAELGSPGTGGGGEAAWPVPYWFGDAAMATMLLLLGAEEAGLAACFLGSFRGEKELLGTLGVPAQWRLFGTVLMGHPDGRDHRSPSLNRPTPPRPSRIHRGRWPEGAA